jgi:hypothetical protein
MRLPDRLGFRGKTLWDWLQLLIVPAILIGVTFVWSATQTSSDNKREDRRIAADRAAAEEVRQDTTLNDYFQQMSDLMLNKKLKSSKLGDAVRSVARTVTLTTVRRLNGERRGEVVRFLYEADLIEEWEDQSLVIDLTGANLAGADVSGANLGAARFPDVDFTGADLSNTFLQGADLSEATLTGADLSGAWLRIAYVRHADLERANLRDAQLDLADLGGANLRGADLTGAGLFGAYLGGAKLKGAILAGAYLGGADDLDLEHYIAQLSPEKRNAFLDSQKEFLDSLSPKELAKFNLSPEKLAKLRREAKAA